MKHIAKRSLALLLALAMLLSLAAVTLAASDVQVVIEDAALRAGETAYLPVRITSSKGIQGVNFQLVPSEGLEIVDFQSSYDGQDGAADKGFFDSKVATGKIAWSNTKDLQTDRVFFWVGVKAAAAGRYTLTITSNEGKVMFGDENKQAIPFDPESDMQPAVLTVTAANSIALTGDTVFAAPLAGQTNAIELTKQLTPKAYGSDAAELTSAAFTYALDGLQSGMTLENGVLTLYSNVAAGTYTLRVTASAGANAFGAGVSSLTKDFTFTVTKEASVLSGISVQLKDASGKSGPFPLPTADAPTLLTVSIDFHNQYGQSFDADAAPSYRLSQAGTALTAGVDYKIEGDQLTLYKTASIRDGQFYTLSVSCTDEIVDLCNFQLVRAAAVAVRAELEPPAAMEIPVTGESAYPLAVRVYDQYGDLITDSAILNALTFETASANFENHVRLSADRTQLLVEAAAKDIVARGETKDFTLSLKSGETVLAGASVPVRRAASRLASVSFTLDGQAVTGSAASLTIPAGAQTKTAAIGFTAADQYGESYADVRTSGSASITLTSQTTHGTQYTFTVTDKADSAVSFTFTVTAQALRFAPADSSQTLSAAIFAPSVKDAPVYGDRWSEIVTLGRTDGVVNAAVGSETVPGTFSVLDGTPDAGSHSWTIVFNSTDGTYQNVPVCTGDAVTIAPRPLTLAVRSDAVFTKTYDGTTACPSAQLTTEKFTLDGILPGDTVTLDAGRLTAAFNAADVKDAASLTVSWAASPLDNGNYTLSGSSLTVSSGVSITPKAVSLPAVTVHADYGTTAAEALTLLGAQTVTFDGRSLPLRELVELTAVGGQTGNALLTAGSHTAAWQQLDGSNYSFTGLTLTVAVDALSLSSAELTLAQDTFTYNAAQQTAVPVLTLGGKTLTAGTDYTVSGNVRTDAGSYTLTVEGRGGYAGTRTANWTILPASFTDLGCTVNCAPLTFVYDGSAHTPAVSSASVRFPGAAADTALSASDYTVSLSEASPVNAGTYTLTLTGRGNYTGSSAPVSFEITRAALTLSASAATRFAASGSAVLTVPAGRDDAIQLGTPAVTGEAADGLEQVSAVYDAATGAIAVSWSVRDDASLTGKNAVITVPIPQQRNYAAGSAAVTVTITEKLGQTVTFSGPAAASASYAQGSYRNTASAQTAVTYSLSGANASEIAEIDAATGLVRFRSAGTVTVTATAAETRDYASASASYTLTITKSMLLVTASGAAITVGQPLPSFTASVSGLKAGETAELVFVTPPTASTAADGRTAGSFAVVPGNTALNDYGAARYTVTAVSGVLTVLPERGMLDILLPGFITGSTCEAGYTDCACEVFTDLDAARWYHASVDWAWNEGLMTGTGASTFSPNAAASRAMTWTMLARIAGQDTRRSSTWYEVGRTWAMAQGITDGTDPLGTITREQLAAMLYRYAGSPAVSGTLTFADSASVSSWAQDAMLWAVQTGLLNGVGGNRLNPLGTTTRAQAAAIFQRLTKLF